MACALPERRTGFSGARMSSLLLNRILISFSLGTLRLTTGASDGPTVGNDRVADEVARLVTALCLRLAGTGVPATGAATRRVSNTALWRENFMLFCLGCSACASVCVILGRVYVSMCMCFFFFLLGRAVDGRLYVCTSRYMVIVVGGSGLLRPLYCPGCFCPSTYRDMAGFIWFLPQAIKCPFPH